MTINLEPAYEPMVRREAAPVAVAPSLAQASGGAAHSAAIAVPPLTKSEDSPAPASEQERKRKPAEAQPQASSQSTPVRTGTYEHRIVYVNEADRLFLDVVNRDNDEVLMRIPSETLAKFLRQAESPMSATSKNQTAGGLDTLA